MYFLDSDICINLLRGKIPTVYEFIRSNNPDLFAIPAIVESDLRTGALKSQHPRKNVLLLERFLEPFQSVPFDHACSIAYARIRAELERQGQSIGSNDLLIAATAVTHQATLITGNIREFKRVPGLCLEEWDDISI